ncbi:DUF2092 domain-containing protein [Streptosporangium soli]|nr:DUF2092 domain-containing protein [Streptosporangium sp. KLBMP 9127]
MPVAVVAVIGAAAGTGPVIAAVQGEPTLPERTAEQLLVEAAGTAKSGEMPPMSGTVVETASFGIPGLPQVTGESSSPLSLLSGSHEAKVWYGGDNRMRLALPGRMSETNLIVNGDQAWMYESEGNKATRIKLPADAAAQPQPPLPTAAVTPQEAAKQLLAMAAEHSTVSVTNNEQVAGRTVYQLVLAPKAAGSLVKEVRLALDGETYVPLRVQVYAKNAIEPAFEVGYSTVTFSPPAAENFTFTPPAGAKVEEITLGEAGPGKQEKEVKKEVAGMFDLVGKGWTTVAVVPFDLAKMTAGAERGEPAGAEQGERGGFDEPALAETVLKAAKQVNGSWGSGRLIETKLATALLTDDGRLLAGAVTPDVLFEAAGRK